MKSIRTDAAGRVRTAVGGPDSSQKSRVASSTVHQDRWGMLNYTRSERFKSSRGGKGVYAKWDTHRRIYCYGERVR